MSDHESYEMPGFPETARMIRVVITIAVLVLATAIGSLMQCAAEDPRLEQERELAAEKTDEHWRHVRAGRERAAEVAAALRDSLVAVRRSAPAVRRAIARADSARSTIAIGADTALENDTTEYVAVRRPSDPRTYVTPAFITHALELHQVALDSAIRQMGRLEHAVETAELRMHLDSVTMASYDSLVASLQQEKQLANRAIGVARRRGRAEGFKAGAIVTGLLALVLAAIT